VLVVAFNNYSGGSSQSGGETVVLLPFVNDGGEVVVLMTYIVSAIINLLVVALDRYAQRFELAQVTVSDPLYDLFFLSLSRLRSSLRRVQTFSTARSAKFLSTCCLPIRFLGVLCSSC
jgi:hypothetical protein